MTRMTARDIDPQLLELYDFYAHDMISKRAFLDRAGKFAVGGLTAAALVSMMSPNYALAEQVSFTDPDIVAEYVTCPAPDGPAPNGNGTVLTSLVRPAGQPAKYPAGVVVHENRGLNPYIEDVARRLARTASWRWNHGCHNDSTPHYDKAAAELAWQRTIAHFRAHLA